MFVLSKVSTTGLLLESAINKDLTSIMANCGIKMPYFIIWVLGMLGSMGKDIHFYINVIIISKIIRLR